MPRYKAIIEYEGGSYNGLQIQAEGKTIISVLQEAIYQFSQEKISLVAAGRTDAGVHAKAMVIHFDLSKNFLLRQVRSGINFYLKDEQISLLKVTKAKSDFHARFSAKERSYEYLILNRPSPSPLSAGKIWYLPKKLNLAKMKQAASYLIGEHDFSSFRNTACQSKTPIKSINQIKISKKNHLIKIHISAPSFLYNQVRIIVGTLVEIGWQKQEPENMKDMLNACDRKKAGPTAPASGLYFAGVRY